MAFSKRTSAESSYTIGRVDISINDTPLINAEELQISTHQNQIEIDGIRKNIDVAQIRVTFNVNQIEITEKQTWFINFNSLSMVGSSFEKFKLSIKLDDSNTFNLIGYLMLKGITTKYADYSTFEFDFNGVVGEDLSVVPDPYEDSIIAEAKQKEAESAEFPQCDDCQYKYDMDNCAFGVGDKEEPCPGFEPIVTIKAEKRAYAVKYKKEEVIKILERKITF